MGGEIETNPQPTGPAPAARSMARTAVLLAACAGALIWAFLVARDSSATSRGLVRALRSGGVSDRLEAARSLSGVSPGEAAAAIPALVEATRDGDEAVSLAAIRSLGDLGIRAMHLPDGQPQARAAADGLVRILSDPREPARTEAAVMLNPFAHPPEGFDGPPFDVDAATSALIEIVLKDPAIATRVQAMQTLLPAASASKNPPPPALFEALAKGKSAADRESAACILGVYPVGREATVKALVAALKDDDPRARRGSAFALGGMGKDAAPALPALIAAMKVEVGPEPGPAGPGLRVDRASGLSGTATFTVQAALPMAGVAPEFWDSAPEAARAIGSIVAESGPDPASIAALAEAIRTGPFWRRDAAEDALVEIGPAAKPAIPDLIAALNDAIGPEKPGFGWGSARALGRVAPGTDQADRAMEALTAALGAKWWSVRAEAAEALGRFGLAAKPALPRLEETVKAGEQPGEAAKKSIRQIQSPARPAGKGNRQTPGRPRTGGPSAA